MTDCELGFGPLDPVPTTFEPEGRCDSTNDSTEAGSSGMVQVLYATALAEAVVSSGACGPIFVPLD